MNNTPSINNNYLGLLVRKFYKDDAQGPLDRYLTAKHLSSKSTAQMYAASSYDIGDNRVMDSSNKQILYGDNNTLTNGIREIN